MQRGTGNIVLLATGSTTNAAAFDLYLDFTGRNAGTITLDWAQLSNPAGNRGSTFTLQTNTGTSGAFVILPGSSVSVVNGVASSGTLTTIALPAGFNNKADARIRFYLSTDNAVGTTGNRPKFSIDNIAVTSTLIGATPVITVDPTTLPPIGCPIGDHAVSSTNITVNGPILTATILW
ncbi:hypothetical protein [Flavobacterium sp. 3HN19-14]|uniref:hypothetical protein n=1 Tax=Flavobacterium sp. 3HN19-14 TaxID=3448133 RepID=UPI003EDF1579